MKPQNAGGELGSPWQNAKPSLCKCADPRERPADRVLWCFSSEVMGAEPAPAGGSFRPHVARTNFFFFNQFIFIFVYTGPLLLLGLSLAVREQGLLLGVVLRLPLQWPPLWPSTGRGRGGCRTRALVAPRHMQPSQTGDCPWRWQVESYPLCHQGSPKIKF